MVCNHVLVENTRAMHFIQYDKQMEHMQWQQRLQTQTEKTVYSIGDVLQWFLRSWSKAFCDLRRKQKVTGTPFQWNTFDLPLTGWSDTSPSSSPWRFAFKSSLTFWSFRSSWNVEFISINVSSVLVGPNGKLNTKCGDPMKNTKNDDCWWFHFGLIPAQQQKFYATCRTH